ncbi:MAG: hypothetical protein JWR27_2347 [Aeromicrobium sp.]|nr:hypothetical protein [Aeromicrobium sp.]
MRPLAAIIVLLLVSACAGIPSSGPVRKVSEDGGLGESSVRYSPAGPVAGASPEQIVRGYLDAMLAFPTTSRTASAFLTPEAAKAWNPAGGVRIYSKTEVAGRVPSTTGLDDPRGVSKGAVDVRLGFREEARLDRQGHYVQRNQSSSSTFTLQQVDGQWRIVNPDEGLLVNEKFFTDYFRSFNLFFFDRPGRRLVADPVYQVVGDQLATSLVTSLGRGPGTDASASARTYVPPLKDLRPSVPVSDDGVADVEFTADLGGMGDSARDRLSAQIVWTLRQVPGVDGIQIVGGSSPLTANGRGVQPISSWGGYGPSLAQARAYAVADDRVVELHEGKPTPVSGSWGKDARGAALVAVSEAGIAGVLPGRGQVRISDRDGGDALTVAARDAIGPHWDPDGTLWLVDRGVGGTRVRIVEGEKQRLVDAADLAGRRIDTFALSPDGTRYAVTSPTSGGQIRVGAVLRDARDRLLGLGMSRRVRPTVAAPRSVSWSSPTELAFLARGRSGVQAYQVSIDGSATSADLTGGASLPDVGAVALAIGTGETPELWATDSRRRLWFLAARGSWRLLEGPKVTALTAGT